MSNSKRRAIEPFTRGCQLCVQYQTPSVYKAESDSSMLKNHGNCSRRAEEAAFDEDTIEFLSNLLPGIMEEPLSE